MPRPSRDGRGRSLPRGWLAAVLLGAGLLLAPALIPGVGLIRAGDAASLVPAGPPRAHDPGGEGLAGARLEPGDSPWRVERAWGPPWRRYMVNLFQDEEHLVYRDPTGRPILLRFRGGQLQPPAPLQPPWVAAPPPGR